MLYLCYICGTALSGTLVCLKRVTGLITPSVSVIVTLRLCPFSLISVLVTETQKVSLLHLDPKRSGPTVSTPPLGIMGPTQYFTVNRTVMLR